MSDTRDESSELLGPSILQQRAIRGSIWTAIHTLVSVPVAFAANALIARALGVTDYGELAFLTLALALAMQFANFGFSGAVTQWGSAAEAGGRARDAERLLQRSLGFHTLVELPILATLAIALTKDESWWIAITAVGGVSAACFFSGAALSVTIENRTAANAKLAILTNLLLQTASVAAALGTGSAIAVWGVRTMVSGVGVGLALLLLDRRRRQAVLHLRLPWRLGSTFWRFALLTWVAGVLALLVFSRSEVFLLKAFAKDEALGVFALAFGLSQQITAPADSMLHALLPAIAGLASVWPERLEEAFERATRVTALACGTIAVAVIPALVFLVPLIYGSAFGSAAWLFIPLAVASCWQSVSNPLIAFVNARRRAGVLLGANATALAVDVVLAVLLIPPFAAWGAVVANAAAQATALLVLARAEPILQGRGARLLLRSCLPFMIGVVVMGASIVVGSALAPARPLLAAVSSIFVGGFVYVLSLRLARTGLTVRDRDALVSAVPGRVQPHVARLLSPITVSATS